MVLLSLSWVRLGPVIPLSLPHGLESFMVLLSLSWARLGKVISLPWPHGLGNWPHGIVILIIGEVVLSHSFTLASWWC